MKGYTLSPLSAQPQTSGATGPSDICVTEMAEVGKFVLSADLGHGHQRKLCLAQASPPHLAWWDPEGYHSDDKKESEMPNILSLRNGICTKQLSSYSIGIQI